MPYAEEMGKKYRSLIYEYPFHATNADEQIDFAAKLLKALSIEKVILIGASDGGVYAQIFAKLSIYPICNYFIHYVIIKAAKSNQHKSCLNPMIIKYKPTKVKNHRYI